MESERELKELCYRGRDNPRAHGGKNLSQAPVARIYANKLGIHISDDKHKN